MRALENLDLPAIAAGIACFSHLAAIAPLQEKFSFYLAVANNPA